MKNELAISVEKQQKREEKIKACKEYLNTKYILHPSNEVHRCLLPRLFSPPSSDTTETSPVEFNVLARTILARWS